MDAGCECAPRVLSAHPSDSRALVVATYAKTSNQTEHILSAPNEKQQFDIDEINTTRHWLMVSVSQQGLARSSQTNRSKTCTAYFLLRVEVFSSILSV